MRFDLHIGRYHFWIGLPWWGWVLLVVGLVLLVKAC